MPTRKAEAEWKGNLAEGSGRLRVGSGALDGPYSFKSRFEEGQTATNPEELIGSAHAGCFSMALTETEAEIPGIDDATFRRHALDAKQKCPGSKALAGTEIHLTATLL